LLYRKCGAWARSFEIAAVFGECRNAAPLKKAKTTASELVLYADQAVINFSVIAFYPSELVI
jgi:hypothetical protein